MYVVGLDVGTSGVKSTLFDQKAQVVGYAYQEYDLISPGDGMFELDPNLLLQKAMEVLTESAAKIDGREIQAICVTSFGESFVLLDEQDRVLSNTMLYMDNRGSEECGEFLRRMPESEIYAVCGQYVDSMFGAYKLRWMSKHRPELLGKAKKLLFITDFITYMLGGEHLCDYSLAARSAMFNVWDKSWWDEGIAFAGIDRAILPKPVPGGSVVGTMSAQIAEKLGMSTGTKLIVGGHDQILAALGSGAYQPGDIANGMGTVDCITAVLDGGKVEKDILLRYKFPVVPFLSDGRYVTYAFNMSGGCAIKWFRDTLAKDLTNGAYAKLDGEAVGSPTNLLVIPYFAGGGTPYMDSDLPATITGMRLNTTRGELFRAFMEGVSYEMKLNLECLDDAGIHASKVNTVGGGAKSKLWMQIRADIFGREVLLPRYSEAGTLASAMLCYSSVGVYGSIPEAQKALVQYDATYQPQGENVKIYGENYQRYKELYRKLKT